VSAFVDYRGDNRNSSEYRLDGEKGFFSRRLLGESNAMNRETENDGSEKELTKNRKAGACVALA
jgi:hypothetical protein